MRAGLCRCRAVGKEEVDVIYFETAHLPAEARCYCCLRYQLKRRRGRWSDVDVGVVACCMVHVLLGREGGGGRARADVVDLGVQYKCRALLRGGDDVYGMYSMAFWSLNAAVFVR